MFFNRSSAKFDILDQVKRTVSSDCKEHVLDEWEQLKHEFSSDKESKISCYGCCKSGSPVTHEVANFANHGMPIGIYHVAALKQFTEVETTQIAPLGKRGRLKNGDVVSASKLSDMGRAKLPSDEARRRRLESARRSRQEERRRTLKGKRKDT
ncbi:hypothetical protein CEXT_386271 [Caerostris extrusa]|uniref:Uncharacterized protein n=1 Tax=Caerostris extrusa TaxID=172846 RepID=A0AAV4P4W6_CAEEX|nr:hypothetical protein CEXT_386271 [Caerostris extrusa]